MRKIVFGATCLPVAILASSAGLQAQTCPDSLSCAAPSAAFSAVNTTSTGQVYGIKGTTASSSGDAAGLYGIDGSGTVCSVNTPSAGVRGESWGFDGVIGLSSGQANAGAGVAGYSISRVCIAGVNSYGLLGTLRTVGGVSKYYGVFAGGDFGGTGAKYFVEPHPTDPTKEIRYVSLEGPEAGTYFRGTGRIVDGVATIEVPKSFRMVTDENGLTVVVTPVGDMAMIAVVKQGLDEIVVRGSKDVRFNYLVNGVRKAFKDFEAISDNVDFVPDGPNDNRFSTLPAESQQRLIATGVYTPEGKVNLLKAHEMGWDQAWEFATSQGLQPPTNPGSRR